MPDPQSFEIIEKTSPYEGYYRIDRFRVRHSLHDGGTSALLEREVFERGHVGAVLPVDPARDRVVLIEQFRPGALAAGWHPWVIECVAGVIEEGESPEDLARREAVEEAGCAVTDLKPVFRFLTSPGASSETVTLFAGRVDTENVGGVHGLVEEGEDIRVLVMGVDEALALLQDGRIVNAKTIIALQWLAANYATLKAEWQAGA
ncbi:MAG: NUDIX domain-containing protein [Rhodospirillales bacterium]